MVTLINPEIREESTGSTQAPLCDFWQAPSGDKCQNPADWRVPVDTECDCEPYKEVFSCDFHHTHSIIPLRALIRSGGRVMTCLICGRPASFGESEKLR